MLRMKRHFLAGAAVTAVLMQGAYAEDLSARSPLYNGPPTQVYGWTGFYVGGNVGYGWGHSDVTGSSAEFGDISGSTSVHPRSIIGGLQAGYNLQTSRNWVVGLETDFQWSGQKGSASGTHGFSFPVDFEGGPAPDGTFTGTGAVAATSRLNWLGTTRGRIGFVSESMPGLMWYGTGGLAYGRVETSVSASAAGFVLRLPTSPGSTCNGAGCAFTAQTAFEASKIKIGWAAGFGVEGMLRGAWTWKLEYLHVDLGNATGAVAAAGTSCIARFSPVPVCTTGTGGISYSNKLTDDIIRIGLNYKWAS